MLTRRPRTRRWLLVLALAIVAGVATAVTIGTINLFVHPFVDRPRQVDAVVVLGPGLHGERLREGMQMMQKGFGKVLLISQPQNRGWAAGSRLCSGRSSFEVICFRATPFTTRGEAKEVVALGSRNHLRSVLVVTSTYHVSRVRLLYERCFAGEVDVVGADPKASLTEWVGHIVHEWGGLAEARLLERTC